MCWWEYHLVCMVLLHCNLGLKPLCFTAGNGLKSTAGWTLEQGVLFINPAASTTTA